ncbi:MAG: DUF2130 domain-containing protein [Chloroflexi bacterium]|nr:DUF2130 domain-containing protein [Chloroflexota bacterium]
MDEQQVQRTKDLEESVKQRDNTIFQLSESLERFRKTSEDLQRQLVEQKDAQTLGRLGERELESTLKSECPADRITRIRVGAEGADYLHEVFDGDRRCGAILWEMKNTNRFLDAWIGKLKEDKQKGNAEFGVLVSRAVRQRDGDFSKHGEVLIAKAQENIVRALASVLRNGLIQLAQRGLSTGDTELKVGQIMDYLTGPKFMGHLQNVKASLLKLEGIQRLERDYMEDHVWRPQQKEFAAITAAAGTLNKDVSEIIQS